MAVTLTVAELQAALRLGDTAEETAEITRVLAYCTEAVTQHAPNAPDVAQNEAVRRLAGYLYDQPEASRNAAYANALRNSGAQRMLLPYRVHRLGIADAVEAAQEAIGTVSNPVVDVSYSGDVLTVTYADGATEDFTIAGGVGGDDQTARDAAEAAQTRADEAYVKADGAETTAEDAESTADTTSEGLETHISQHPGGSSGPAYTLLATGHLNNIRAGFSFTTAEAATLRAAWGISHHFELRFKLSAAQYVTREVRTIPNPLPSTPIQVYAGIATSTAGEPKVVDLTMAVDSAGVGTGVDNTWPTGATLEVYGVS